MGDPIEIRPGIVKRDAEGRLHCKPIFSKIVSLHAENNDLPFAVPGGLIGVGTGIDPTLCRADCLVGQVLGAVGKLPSVYVELEVKYFLLRRLLGVRATAQSLATPEEDSARVGRLQKNEILKVNIGSTSIGCKIVVVRDDMARIVLTRPACTEIGEKVALSRRIENHWRLIGWGEIRRGTTIELDQ